MTDNDPVKDVGEGRSTPAAAGLTPQQLRDTYAFLRAAGQVINNSSLYGAAHKITLGSLNDSYKQLAQLLQGVERINLSVVDGELLVEGKPIELKNPFINLLADRLDSVGVSGFSLMQGLPEAEYKKLMEVLMSPKPEDTGGEFADLVEKLQLEHVFAERVRYERVSESETVTEKEDEGEAAQRAVAEAMVEQIMAFLKGEAGISPDEVARSLTDMASDAERLANLIMEAAAVRQQQSGLSEGESLADIVVGCLRRTFEGLVRDPAARTKKGKNAVKKIMLLLEKTVLDKLHAIAKEADPSLDEAIAGVVDEMIGDLEIESLTAEYVKKRHAMEETEKRVLHYLQAHGDDPTMANELQERLVEAGLTPDGWKELVVKSGKLPETAPAAAPGGGEGGGAVGTDAVSLGVLAMLLSELDQMMTSVTDPHAVGNKLVEIGQHAQDVANLAARRLEDLRSVLQQEDEILVDMDETSRAKVKMSRAALMELLAEIVQELCQSLSAINCAVGMTLAGHIGDINEDQKQVLSVAATCGHRLDDLLDRLIEIVGLPKGLQPDKEKVYGPGYKG
jgi:hypothetical protein